MEKGKFGIRVEFYAVVAFLFVIFGYSTPLFLLAGVVLFAEKNEWAGRQVIQAICLMFAAAVINEAFGILSFFYSIPVLGSIWSVIVSIIDSLVEIAVLVFAIIALVKVAKGKEAGIPLADKFAYWAYGLVVAKPQPVVQPVAPAQPVAQPMAPAQPAAPAVCSNCGEALNGAAFCTKCGTPAAK